MHTPIVKTAKFQLSDLQSLLWKGRTSASWPNLFDHGDPSFVLWPFRGLNSVLVMYINLTGLRTMESVRRHQRSSMAALYSYNQSMLGAVICRWRDNIWRKDLCSQELWPLDHRGGPCVQERLKKSIPLRLICCVRYGDDNSPLSLTILVQSCRLSQEVISKL
jgi:hypothetical protein